MNKGKEMTVLQDVKIKVEGGDELTITAKDLTDIFCPLATQKELMLALGIIKSLGLNPFKREVHLIKYDATRPASIVVGYEVYLQRANRSGQLNGWGVELTQDGKRAICTIYRKDWAQPFVWSVAKSEADKNQSTWKSQPEMMLKKVAISQAFRLAFPDDCGGLPYTAEEQTIIDADHTTRQPAETIDDMPKEVAKPAPATAQVPAVAPATTTAKASDPAVEEKLHVASADELIARGAVADDALVNYTTVSEAVAGLVKTDELRGTAKAGKKLETDSGIITTYVVTDGKNDVSVIVKGDPIAGCKRGKTLVFKNVIKAGDSFSATAVEVLP